MCWSSSDQPPPADSSSIDHYRTLDGVDIAWLSTEVVYNVFLSGLCTIGGCPNINLHSEFCDFPLNPFGGFITSVARGKSHQSWELEEYSFLMGNSLTKRLDRTCSSQKELAALVFKRENQIVSLGPLANSPNVIIIILQSRVLSI